MLVFDMHIFKQEKCSLYIIPTTVDGFIVYHSVENSPNTHNLYRCTNYDLIDIVYNYETILVFHKLLHPFQSPLHLW